MGLSTKKEEQLRRMPQIEFNVFRSKDGRFLVHRTTITDVKPINYYKKVVENIEQTPVDEYASSEDAAPNASP
ncbi:MAG: hypothetical protein ACOCWQ_02330 [Nanoarchaeota archaeon]